MAKNTPKHRVGTLGREILGQWSELRYAAAVVGTVSYLSFLPRVWKRRERKALARQILATGVEPSLFVVALALFLGISLVVQLTLWAGKVGQSQLLGPLLVTVVAREVGPVLITLVVIVRSGSAMTTELGVLKVEGAASVLETAENDPFVHLVLPRILAMAISTFCLTVVFILTAFASGYMFAALTGKGTRDLLLFADTVSRAIQPKDVFNVLAKSILPALFAGASCCIGGMGVGSVTEIPPATQRALTRSIGGLFAISLTVSLLTYL